MHENLINIATIAPKSHALGPGLRYIIWLQGCPFSCIECISPKFIINQKNNLISLDKIASCIINQKGIEGITLTGGEPFSQAAQLNRLIKLVKSQVNINVISFTGYLLNNLNWPEAQLLLKHIDVLIDGPYIKDKHTNKGLRGSSNQTIHFFTSKFKNQKDEILYGDRQLEIVARDNETFIIGIPNSRQSIELRRKI